MINAMFRGRASFGRDGIIHTLIKRRPHGAPETSSTPWNDKRPECEIIYSRYARSTNHCMSSSLPGGRNAIWMLRVDVVAAGMLPIDSLEVKGGGGRGLFIRAKMIISRE